MLVRGKRERLTLPTNWTAARKLEKPLIDTLLVEDVFALTWKHTKIVPLLEIDDTYRTSFASDLIWQNLCDGSACIRGTLGRGVAAGISIISDEEREGPAPGELISPEALGTFAADVVLTFTGECGVASSTVGAIAPISIAPSLDSADSVSEGLG